MSYIRKKTIFFCCLFLSFLHLYGVTAWARVSEAEKAYRQAEKALKSFAHSPRIRYRRYWIRIINNFKRVYLQYPESPWAPKALYKTGRLYEELYGYSGRRKDLIEALKHYRLLWERYPRHSLVDDALKRAIYIYEKRLQNPVQALALKRELRKIASRKHATHKPLKPKAKSRKSSLKKEKLAAKKRTTSEEQKHSAQRPEEIHALRHWSSADYSRVVIDLSGKVNFKAHLLKAYAGRPPRLYVDCTPAKLSPYLKPIIPIKDGLLQQVRLGVYRPGTVRIVLDLKSLSQYRVFFLDDPPRLVVDLIGGNLPAEGTGCRVTLPKKGPLSLAQQLGLCVKRVVIDPGHGGKDPGARSRLGLREKDVVLKVARLLAQKLRKEGFQVILTRNKDSFIPLEQRTAIANMKKADLFISIHVNSSPNRRARGVETYYLNFASDKEAMRVAALENAASTRSLGELQDLLRHILLNTKVEESKRLAEDVQKAMVRSIRRRYRYVKDRGVKTAPFVVLIGTRMPAVLVEIGFISNRYEERRLRSKQYLEAVADGLARGITNYMKQIKISYR